MGDPVNNGSGALYRPQRHERPVDRSGQTSRQTEPSSPTAMLSGRKVELSDHNPDSVRSPGGRKPHSMEPAGEDLSHRITVRSNNTRVGQESTGETALGSNISQATVAAKFKKIKIFEKEAKEEKADYSSAETSKASVGERVNKLFESGRFDKIPPVYVQNMLEAGRALKESRPDLLDYIDRHLIKNQFDSDILYLKSYEFTNRFPDEIGFFKVDREISNFQRRIFSVLYTERVLSQLANAKTGEDVEKIFQDVGADLFRELFLSQMRAEAKADNFAQMWQYSQISIKAMEILFDRGDACAALAAARAHATKLGLESLPDGLPSDRGNVDALPYQAVMKLREQPMGRRYGTLEDYQPESLRPLIANLVYYFFAENNLTVAPWSVANDICQRLEFAPVK